MLNKEIKSKVAILGNFCNELMDVFMEKCNYNDFNELSLVKISEIVDDVVSKHIDKLIEGDK
jgi:hypothetical protein